MKQYLLKSYSLLCGEIHGCKKQKQNDNKKQT